MYGQHEVSCSVQTQGHGHGPSIMGELPLHWHGCKRGLTACYAAQSSLVTVEWLNRLVRASLESGQQ